MPARLPHILLNGTTGIAVGMATDISSHNINEIAQALILLLENPDTSMDEVLDIVKATGFPNRGGDYYAEEDFAKNLSEWQGSLKMRASME